MISTASTFVPDQPGDYVINLVVGEAGGSSAPATVTVSAISPSPYPLPAKNADRWMGLIDGLMDRALAEITFPGTLDSGAYWLNVCDDEDCRGPDFAEPPWTEFLVDDEIENQVAYDVAHAHTQTLLQQLNGGIRYFDLRVTRRGGAFYVYHGLLGRPRRFRRQRAPVPVLRDRADEEPLVPRGEEVAEAPAGARLHAEDLPELAVPAEARAGDHGGPRGDLRPPRPPLRPEREEDDGSVGRGLEAVAAEGAGHP